MNTQIMDSFKDQSEKLLAPSQALSKLMVGKLEQLISLQLASMGEYTELNIGQLKAAAEISNPEDLKEYIEKQRDYMKTVSEKMAGDAQAMVALVREFAQEAQQISLGSVSGFMKNGR